MLTTPRLLLREMVAADAEDHFELSQHPQVQRFNGTAPFSTLDEARTFLANYPDYRLHGFGRWAVIRKEDGASLGWCGLKRLADGEVDLGYCLHHRFWGLGYATEAALASVQHGFGPLGLTRIVGRVHKENSASIAVLEKVGMRYWKTDACEHDQEALFYAVER